MARSSRRLTHVPLRRGNQLRHALHHWHERVHLLPLEQTVDRRGRRRVRGAALRHNAQTMLMHLASVQRRRRHGRLYIGYPAAGELMHRSRSTAYRSLVALRRIGLIACLPGGGKTHNESGEVVERANGYELHPDLIIPDEKAPRRPRRNSAPVSGRAQALVDEARERWKARRAGP